MLKKISVILLVVIMIFSVSGCGFNKADDTNKLATITPYDELPAFSGNFKLVFENVSEVEKSDIEELMGYMVAAYETYSAEDFCTYMYQKDFLDAFTNMFDAISAKASEFSTSTNAGERKMALSMTTVAYSFSSANLSLAQWNTKCASYRLTKEEGKAEELKEEMKYVINEYSVMFFDQAILN